MKKIKGIILAGGHGTRLYPLTLGVSKQLLPVYDKPMVFYPMSVLMSSGISEILIISKPEDLSRFKNLFNDGKNYGIKVYYKEQKKPNGIAESLKIASNFIGNDDICLILGDNIFHGENFLSKLEIAKTNLKKNKATVFGVTVNNPSDFGVIQYNEEGSIINITEKPKSTKSNLIVSGLYFYTNEALSFTKKIKPSKRGELEITDINNMFLKNNNLELIKLNSSDFWSDTGTYSSLLIASKYLQEYEKKTGKKVACLEEIAMNMKLISESEFISLAKKMSKSDYGKYLLKKL